MTKCALCSEEAVICLRKRTGTYTALCSKHYALIKQRREKIKEKKNEEARN